MNVISYRDNTGYKPFTLGAKFDVRYKNKNSFEAVVISATHLPSYVKVATEEGSPPTYEVDLDDS